METLRNMEVEETSVCEADTTDTTDTTDTNEVFSLVMKGNTIPAVIDFNYEELESKLNEKLKESKNLVVTEQSLKGAKNAKAELASARNRLEEFRKSTKKEVEKPIKDFEAKCKKLLGLIEETETPLGSAIDIFDEKTREEKREYARTLFAKAATIYSLEAAYAEQFQILPEYTNVSISKKAIRTSVEAQAAALKEKQNDYKKKLEIIETTVENENQRINIKLKKESYTSLLDKMDVVEIINKIKEAADDIFEQENKKEEEVLFAASVPEPTIPVMEEPVGFGSLLGNGSLSDLIPAEEAPVISPMLIPTDDNTTGMEIPFVSSMPFDSAPQAPVEPLFEATFQVTGNFEALRKLNDFIKNNGIEHIVLSQRKVN